MFTYIINFIAICISIFRFVWDHGGDDVYLCIFRDKQNLTLPMLKNRVGKIISIHAS